MTQLRAACEQGKVVSRGVRGDGRRLPRCPFSAAVTIATVPPGFEVVPGKDPNGWSFTWRLAPRRSELFLIATVLLFFNIHSEDQRQLLKKGLQQGYPRPFPLPERFKELGWDYNNRLLL